VKLSTRLALVVSAILVATTVATSAQAFISMRHETLASADAALINLSNQLEVSKEDDLSLALYIAGQSSIPMSLVYVTDNSEKTFLLENAGTNFQIPTNARFLKGTKETIETAGNYERFYPINANEYLGFFISIKEINKELGRSLKSILLFNFFLILIAILLVLIFFRRDSKLNSAAKGMQEFIGDASHELKTPLTVIRGYSEMLATDPANVQKYSKRINDESLRMSNIIDRLLKIAALDEGHRDDAVSIDLTDYLKSQLDDLRMLQPQRSIKFHGDQLMIKAPYELLDTLISNLLTNARVHTPEDAPIHVGIKGKTLVIEDGGPGLKEIPDKPFKRFDSSRSRETGGSGLGMSLIQKSAKELGAKLTFSKSNLGGLKVEINF
jgi:signal transduction histidine kinase